MIRLQKGPVPDVLLRNAVKWTQKYLEALQSGKKTSKSVRFPYRHKQIKEAIRKESHSKCIYCETIVSFGETDHIHPVSRCPEQVVVWKNLALVCKECNTFKGDYHEPAEPLLNPFVDEPSEHVVLLGPMILQQPGNDLGLRTILQIQLNRDDLFQRRKSRIENLAKLVDQWKTHPKPATRELLRQALVEEGADSKDYAAAVRSYLKQSLGWSWPPAQTTENGPSADRSN